MLDNPRWERFCQLFAQDGNAAAAYTGAGFKAKNTATASACASRLLRNASVQARIYELAKAAREAAEVSAIADIREIRERWTSVLREELKGTKPQDVLKAGELLLRAAGQLGPEDDVSKLEVKVELSLSEKGQRIEKLLHGSDR